jgi:signal transduction histidine kinase
MSDMPVNILLLEDSPLDADLACSRLAAGGVTATVRRVETRQDFIDALSTEDFDLILADYSLPSFDGLSALRIAQEMKPDTPCMLVSGVLGEELAVEALKAGAVDYVLKQRLDRLVPSVRRALNEATERRRREAAEVELHKAKEVAEAANRAKDAFLAVLSHELRTPLSPILTTVHLLELEPGLSPEVREAVEVIKRNVELEARLIDDLLDVTRIARGKLQLHLQPVELHDIVDAVLQICQSEVRGKQHRIRTELNAPRDLVQGDPARLQQVLWNLLKNAVKFTPAHGNIVVRTSNEQTPDGERVVLEVVDNGIGIAPDRLPHIFSAFEQGDPIINRQFGGLGLGLAIAHALVEKHHGTLTACSDGLNQGACFRVSLPLLPEQAANDQPRRTPGIRTDGHTRILLIEDHQDTARAMSRLLQRMGHQVQVAGTVKTATQLLDSEPFDLLISDIGLPDGSGVDLMRSIRSRHSIPAIALTGFGMDQDIANCREAGFSEHLVKPVDTAKLKAVIQHLKNKIARG